MYFQSSSHICDKYFSDGWMDIQTTIPLEMNGNDLCWLRNMAERRAV